MLFINIRTK